MTDHLTFTIEKVEYFDNGRIPTIDLEIWIEDCDKEFYRMLELTETDLNEELDEEEEEDGSNGGVVVVYVENDQENKN